MFVDLVQGTQEWLDWRQGRFQSSEAPIIMGLSPYKTPYQLWLEKTGQVAPPPPHPGMLRGHKLEPEARERRELETFVQTPPVCLECEYDGLLMGASLDGYADRGNNKHLLREIKAPANPDHELALAGQIPTKYRDQMEHQVLVISTAFGAAIDDIEGEYLSYRPGHPKGEMAVVAFKANPTRWLHLIGAYKAFLQHIEDGTEPMGDRFQSAAWQWRVANDALEDAKQAEAYARKCLIEAVPEGMDRNEGAGVLVTRSTRAGSVKSDAVLQDLIGEYNIPPERIAELKETHRGKDSVTWRVTPKGLPAPPEVEVARDAIPAGTPDWTW